jgi:hypothetical protein
MAPTSDSSGHNDDAQWTLVSLRLFARVFEAEHCPCADESRSYLKALILKYNKKLLADT